MPHSVALHPAGQPLHRPPGKIMRLCVVVIAIAWIVALGAGFMLTRLDAGTAEHLINRFWLASKQRTLNMEGPMHLSLWPVLTVQLGPCTLSEHSSTDPWLRIESMRWTMHWLPLFEKRVVLSSLQLEGLSATVTRDANGQLNIADLIATGPDTGWTFHIDDLQLSRSHLRWRDAPPSREMALDDLNLKAGPLPNGPAAPGHIALSGQLRSPSAPILDAQLSLMADYHADPVRQSYTVHGIHLNMADHAGDRIPGQLELNLREFRLTHPAAEAHDLALTLKTPSHQLSLTAPRLDLSGTQLHAASLNLNVSSHVKNDGIDVTLRGHITTPLTLDFATQALNLDKFNAVMDITAPQQLARPLHLTGTGQLLTTGGQKHPMQMMAQLQGRFDDGPMNIALKRSPSPVSSSPPRIDFQLDMDRLNLDHWIKASVKPVGTARPSPTPLAWNTPSTLDVQGEVNLGELTASGLRIRKLRLVASSRNGLLTIHPPPIRPSMGGY